MVTGGGSACGMVHARTAVAGRVGEATCPVDHDTDLSLARIPFSTSQIPFSCPPVIVTWAVCFNVKHCGLMRGPPSWWERGRHVKGHTPCRRVTEHGYRPFGPSCPFHSSNYTIPILFFPAFTWKPPAPPVFSTHLHTRCDIHLPAHPPTYMPLRCGRKPTRSQCEPANSTQRGVSGIEPGSLEL